MKKRENILEIIICFFMVFSLVYIFGLVLKVDISLFLQGFIVFLVTLVVKVIIFNPIFIYVFILFSFFAIILLNLFHPILISPFLEKSTLLLSNIFENLAGRGNVLDENVFLFWGILLIILSIFTGLIIFKKKKVYILLPVYFIFFLYYWYIHIDLAYLMMVLFLFSFFIILTLRQYNFKVLFSPWIWTGAVYGFIIIILALSLPKTINIIKWPWLETKVYNSFPEIENWRSSSSYSRKYGEASYFDFSTGGYQGTPSRLGGPVNLNDEKLMTVYSDSPQYLRGNIKHRYNGDYWETSNSVSQDYRSGNDVSNLSRFAKKNFFEKSTIRIKYNSFSSKTIFSPYIPYQIYLENESEFKVDQDYALITEDGVFTGESYKVISQVQLPYNELMELDISYSKEDIKNLNKYLQIPQDRITEATKDLTKDIVGQLDEDLEKAMALEEYLRENYEYSLDPNVVPEDHEFIDYFLFQEKKGYCTYYATTLAIMLRLENIPSRYVEGYLAKDLKEEGVYEVTQENAHAWVEAFIEPIGWIRLEATPAYPTIPRLSEIVDESISERIVRDYSPVFPDEDPLEEDSKIKDQEDIVENNTNIDGDEKLKGKKIGKKLRFQILLIFILTIFFLMFLLVFLKKEYKKIRIKKLSSRKQVIYLYNDILKLIEVLGYPKKIGETPREYGNRLSLSFYYFHDTDIKDITEIFIKTKYGNSPVVKNDLLELEKFKNSLKLIIRNNFGILRRLKLYVKLL